MKMNKMLCALAIGLTVAVGLGVSACKADAAAADALSYKKYGTGIAITDCNSSYSGSMKIPGTLGGKTVISLADNAFSQCAKITEITMPDSITTMGQNAFSGCNALKNIVLSKRVNAITYRAFSGCASLQKVVIPSSVTAIEAAAFADCDSLERAYIPKSVTSISASAFDESSEDLTLYIQQGNTNAVNVAKANGLSYKTVKAPVITAQPKKVNVANGKTAKTTVKVTGTGLKYQWYVKSVGSSKYSKSSVKSATYSVTMSSKVAGRLVYCVVTDVFGNTVKTDTVRLTNLAITSQPKKTNVANGITAKVTVKATGAGLKYQWYVKNYGSSKYSKSSVKSATYSVTMGSKVAGRLVYCVITDQYGNRVQTDTVRLTNLAVTSQPTSVKTASGKTAKVTVKATGTGLKYQWYVKDAGSSKYSKSSIKSATYSVKMSSKVSGRLLYCKITDKYGNLVQTKTVSLRRK